MRDHTPRPTNHIVRYINLRWVIKQLLFRERLLFCVLVKLDRLVLVLTKSNIVNSKRNKIKLIW